MTIRKHHPKWTDTAITPPYAHLVKSRSRDSWWTKAAAPDQREQFIVAARERQRELVTMFVAGYAEADGEAAK